MHMTADTSCCLAGKHGFTQEDMYGKEIMVNTTVGYSFKLREAPLQSRYYIAGVHAAFNASNIPLRPHSTSSSPLAIDIGHPGY